jgi:phosphopantothenoylcysteine decarboxylase / phosphopantothenate---cysteine ligase
VFLVSGPTALQPPPVREVVRVRRAVEMHDAMLALAEGADAIVMAAAVANYTPVSPAGQKIAHDSETMTLQLERTPDILRALASWRAARGGGRPVLVGFAAETHDVVERARAKRLRKGIDLIVANDVSRSDAGFEVDTNAVTLVGAGPDETIALASKAAIAGTILDRLARLLAAIPSAVS